MTKFKILEPKDLMINKKYLIIEILEKPDFGYLHTTLKGNPNNLNYGNYIDTLCGIVKNIYYDKDKNIIEVSFDKMNSILTGQISNRTFFYVSNTLFFEFLSKKESIQKNMEKRNLRDIMRNITGDDKFSHYLFDESLNKIKDQIELLEIADQISEIIDEEPLHYSDQIELLEIADQISDIELSPIELNI